MRWLVTALALCLAPAAGAEPAIRIVDFTADWCPNCKRLDPRIADAVDHHGADAVDLVELDLTRIAGRYSPAEQQAARDTAIATVNALNAAYIWDWYGPTTGLAVVIAADTGEPITCLTPRQTTRQIIGELRLARLLAEHAPPGRRQQGELACPLPQS